MDPHIWPSKTGPAARTYIQQLCEDTGCSPEDLPEAMNDREKWRERVKDIHATSMTWWWWWWHLMEYNGLQARLAGHMFVSLIFIGCPILLALCYISSSSGCAISTDLPDPFSPPLSIVHHFWQVFRATSCIGTELLYVDDRPAFACPCGRVHWNMSLTSLSLLLQQCPTGLLRLTWIVFVMGGKWPCSCCFVGCCLQDLFNIAHSILMLHLS